MQATGAAPAPVFHTSQGAPSATVVQTPPGATQSPRRLQVVRELFQHFQDRKEDEMVSQKFARTKWNQSLR
jgi:hypothetical protein